MADRERKRFRHRAPDKDTIKERQTKSGGDFDRIIQSKIPTFRPDKGETTLRILPPTWEDVEKWGKNWGIDLYIHRNVGPDNQSYLCKKKMLGEPCYLCDTIEELKREDEDAAKEIRPALSIGCYIIDRDAEKEGPQFYTMPQQSVEKEIQLRSIDKRSGEVLDITNPEDGYDVSYSKTGERLKTRYNGVEIARSPSPIHDNQKTQDKWLEFITENPLPDMLIFHDNEYLKKQYAGGAKKKRRDDDEEDQDDRKKRSSRDEYDDEEKDEKPSRRRLEPDDDDEDERPQRRKRNADPEENDDDDDRPKRKDKKDEYDDEEDEKPQRRRRSDPDDDEDEKPKRKGKKDGQEDEDDDPPSTARSAERPKRQNSDARSAVRGRSDDEDDEDDEDEKPKRGKRSDPDDDEEDDAKESITRLKRRHRRDDD